jgi:putative aldouronate transport system substrate-binding protein
MKRVLSIILGIMLVLSITLPAAAVSTIGVKSIKFSNSSISLKTGKAYKLIVAFSPANTNQKALIYSTANKKIATVDADGVITPVGVGQTVITAVSSLNNKIITTCTVNVTKGVALKPITLSYVDAQGSPVTIPSGVQTDPVSVAMQKATGVSLDWDTSVNAEKLNVLIASGDLPDILSFNNNSQLNNLISSNGIKEVSSLVDTNGPNIKTIGKSALTFSRDILSNGTGKLYAIPNRLTAGTADKVYFQPYVGFHIRWDYYKEIGKPAFNSYSDVANAIIQIQKLHPTTADGKKTYGVSMWQDWGLWNYIVISQVVRGLGSFGGANIALTDPNFNFIDGLNDPQASYWVDGAFYNKLYKAGVLDPDSFTQTNAQATAKMEAGQEICQLAYWMVNGQNSTLTKTNAEYTSIPLKGGKYNSAGYNPVGSKYFIISNNCKSPDRAMDVINWMYSDEGSRSLLNGAKGDTWTIDSTGKAVFTEKGLNMKNDKNYVINTGAGLYLNSTGIDPFSMDSTGKQFIDLFNDPAVLSKTLTGTQKEWLSTYGVKSSNDLWHKFGGYALNSTYSMLTPVQSESFKRTDAQIVTYLQSELPRLIMAKTDSDFAAAKAKIIKDITAMDGYKEYMAEAKSSIAKAKAAGDKYK